MHLFLFIFDALILLYISAEVFGYLHKLNESENRKVIFTQSLILTNA